MDTGKTEFNSSLENLKRIGDLLKECGICSQLNEFRFWYFKLKIIRREVMVKMDIKMREDINKLCADIENSLFLYAKFPNNLNLTNWLKNNLDDLELRLRDFMNVKGMLISDGDAGYSATEF